MKVCVVSLNIVPYFHSRSEGQFGGGEVQAGVLARAFASAGHDVCLVTANLDRDQDLPFAAHNAYFSSRGVPLLRFLHPRITGVLDALERADADVYFKHCTGWVNGVTSWFCKKNGKAFVYFAGSDSDFSWRDVNIQHARDKLLYFWGVKNAAGIAAQNQHQANLCRLRLKREARVIPTAVELGGDHSPEKNGSVVWVGGLRAVKRPDQFLELARRLPERRFVLIGGPVSAEPSFGRRILDRAAAVPNLTATGRIPTREVGDHLSRAALLVNTSAWEGFPNAFLEAWARETPVVSFVDVDGVITGEGVGVICSDIDDMTARVRWLLDTDDERRSRGSKARRLIEKRYSSEVAAKAHLEYFEELLVR
jgi:glycosyltransferase involved in cell wall biosynthesis